MPGRVFTRRNEPFGMDAKARPNDREGRDISGQAIANGEIVVMKDGRTNFSEASGRTRERQSRSALFYTFDLPYLDGYDLRRSQILRKRLTTSIPSKVPSILG
jgi:ATP-dependent DNA ligase